jgi:type II secretory pathway component PulK
MSLKNVELQVALPRTVEHSRLVQNQQHQQALHAATTGEELTAQTLQADQTVTESGENARTELRDRQEKKGRRDLEGKKVSGEEEVADAPHPFKGHRLDIKM